MVLEVTLDAPSSLTRVTSRSPACGQDARPRLIKVGRGSCYHLAFAPVSQF